MAICLAIAGNWKLLIADHHSAMGRIENLVGAGSGASGAHLNDYPPVDRSPELGKLDSSNPIPDSEISVVTARVPNPSLSPERFNAALAAGLIDPSRIRFPGPIIPSLDLPAEGSGSRDDLRTGTEHPVDGRKSGPKLVTDGVPSPDVAAAQPTKRTDAVSTLALAIDGIFPTVPGRSAETEPSGGLFAPPQGETLRKDPSPPKKPFSVRFVVRSGTGNPESLLAQRSVRRHDPAPSGNKGEKTTDRRTDDRDSQSQVLTENLQRFALDFVRADQTDNVGEQERFFADSVHFYREGDLSLAGVAAATRRYHREQQTRRSEAAGPAVATGPVNGGFFVIEQPVRWTQSQGSKVLKGRSVLRLRVVPINRGGWKITSIDEVTE